MDAAGQDGMRMDARLLALVVGWMMGTAADTPGTANGTMDNDGRAKMCEASSGTALGASAHVAMGYGALRLKVSGPEEVVSSA